MHNFSSADRMLGADRKTLPTRRRLALLNVLAWALTGCSPTARSMPVLESGPEVKAAVDSLSPYEDGRPPGSGDDELPGEQNSDRMIFGRWFIRYITHDRYGRYSPNFRPMVLHRTIGAAIDDQRAYERAVTQQTAQANAEVAAANAADAAERRRSADAYAAAERERTRLAVAEAEAETKAIATANAAADVQIAADVACRKRRSEAEWHASRDRDDPSGAIARARASIRCPSDKKP